MFDYLLIYLNYLINFYRSLKTDKNACRTVYLTPTISLALQQSAYLRHHTPLKIGIFHYKKGISLWDSEKYVCVFEILLNQLPSIINYF